MLPDDFEITSYAYHLNTIMIDHEVSVISIYQNITNAISPQPVFCYNAVQMCRWRLQMGQGENC